ncbi:TOMM precursor leader peptide-binding protein [Luteipulveratus halotolerans]|uniref:Bacteriocin biosynthesis cyclodehydratase domain-containing protein n=1 Tax=Luteipulveratus halotolerans TaxID=1631356 RepID=A0A0L6CFI0_9MICO|nr:TOMM precursor leader peptide-binding protein [Luteipulveratus halotolerans]KNX36542.1 hypothetical protein VV01_04245 [Luteipulveratus halotolerans]
MSPTDSRSAVILRASPHAPGAVHVSLARLRSVIVAGLEPPDRRVLVELGSTTSSALRAVSSGRTTRPEAAAALRLLASAAEQAAGSEVLTGTVSVTGYGSLRETVAAVVASSGGEVVRDAPTAVRPPVVPTSYAAPDLAVCVSAEVADVARAESWAALGVPVVPVVTHGDRIAVGPVLRPGHGPCAQCLELYRADRDPGRAALGAALLRAPVAADPQPGLGSLAAGLVALIVRGELIGTPAPLGVGQVVSMPHGHVSYHQWSQHPRCPCVTMNA